MLENKRKDSEKQRQAEKIAKLVEPLHTVETRDSGESTQLELSPGSKKTSIFASNLFYYQRRKTNEDRYALRAAYKQARACDVFGLVKSPVKTQEPKFAQPKLSHVNSHEPILKQPKQMSTKERNQIGLVGKRLESAAMVTHMAPAAVRYSAARNDTAAVA